MVLTEYEIHTTKVCRGYTFVMLSDLHNKPYAEVIELTKAQNPDAVFVVGDLVDRHKKTCDLALPFLRECAKIAPTFFAYGNHEIKFAAIDDRDFEETGAVVLRNTYTVFGDKGEFLIGGQKPYTDKLWLKDFELKAAAENAVSGMPRFALLLDHHPEHYPAYLREEHGEKIDLILSGHAHGGQIRIRDRGIFSPGQGIFPKYTHGVYDGKLIVGAGLSNTGGIVPRLGNPTEVIKITVSKV